MADIESWLNARLRHVGDTSPESGRTAPRDINSVTTNYQHERFARN